MKKIFDKFSLKKKEDPKLELINDKTPFAILEAYKSLYSNILYLNIKDKCKKIAISSAVPAEGKSCVSANLALTLAQNLEGKRVLLIDSDMRSPSITHLFSLDANAHGLSEYLSGIDAEPNFQHIPEYNITILSSGAQNVNPTQLISSDNMEQLFKISEERFDYIIVDTPPINVVTDALLLNNLVNGYILSVLSDYSKTSEMDECIDKLTQIDATVFGIVFSAAKVKKYSSKYRNYNRYS